MSNVTASLALGGRNGAPECITASWAEVEPVGFFGLLIRASGYRRWPRDFSADAPRLRRLDGYVRHA